MFLIVCFSIVLSYMKFATHAFTIITLFFMFLSMVIITSIKHLSGNLNIWVLSKLVSNNFFPFEYGPCFPIFFFDYV